MKKNAIALAAASILRAAGAHNVATAVGLAAALVAASTPLVAAADTSCRLKDYQRNVNHHVVTNTLDSGRGSLRAAILAANADGSPSLITFDIPRTALTVPPGETQARYRIHPIQALPAITGPTCIDGQSQEGFTPARLERQPCA